MAKIYFKADYHYNLDNALEQQKILNEHGIRFTTIVAESHNGKMVYWLCLAEDSEG